VAFDDLDEFFDSTLPLPIGGKLYRVPSPPADLGLHCQLTADIARRRRAGLEVSDEDLAMLVLDDDQERVWTRRMLGTAFDEMAADGVDWAKVQHAAQTTYAWVIGGKPAAERMWTGGGAPGEAPSTRQPRAPQDHLPPST
jgi:hypothetical protein